MAAIPAAMIVRCVTSGVANVATSGARRVYIFDTGSDLHISATDKIAQKVFEIFR
ncbi:hypothetical protein [Kutzneria buriramensis]|uniref:Uncharacterized protein n=1 Tax=Kutzneria buriramensis TaxID=1045776 RepID=A0A3E0G4Z6_9PSEU|nr:hypothetical protein [Kutzneria buriramensis]REH17884.1 hypothetical protein BCF44_1411 [Kutzneria buriramensis]